MDVTLSMGSPLVVRHWVVVDVIGIVIVVMVNFIGCQYRPDFSSFYLFLLLSFGYIAVFILLVIFQLFIVSLYIESA